MRNHFESRPDLVAAVVADHHQEVFMEISNKSYLTISSLTIHELKNKVRLQMQSVNYKQAIWKLSCQSGSWIWMKHVRQQSTYSRSRERHVKPENTSSMNGSTSSFI